jgi:hypothetical protein
LFETVIVQLKINKILKNKNKRKKAFNKKKVKDFLQRRRR